MTEAEMVQASASWIGLAYTASRWWLTITMALLAAIYFAARHIPPWFFCLLVALYTSTAISAIFEDADYSSLANAYGTRLAEKRLEMHAPRLPIEPASSINVFNGYLNSALFIAATLCTVAFVFLHWQKERRTG